MTGVMMAKRMTIGQLAREADVGVQTVRYYERRGLLEPAARRESGYREFDDSSLERLRFIRRTQELGFTLNEIGELLELRLDPDTTVAEVQARAAEKITEIDRKMHNLERIKEALENLANRCHQHGGVGDCPLLDEMGPLQSTNNSTEQY